MKIFTYYDASPSAPANQAELIRLWAQSWAAQGWTPRLLTVRHARASRMIRRDQPLRPDAAPWLALEKNGGGWLCDSGVINFSLVPKQAGGRCKWAVLHHAGLAWMPKREIGRIIVNGLSSVMIGSRLSYQHGQPGWADAPVVRFSPDFGLQQILDCGRALKLC